MEGWTADEAGRPVLKVRVSAAPADGAANTAVITLIAKALKRPRSAVRITAGDTARIKRLEIDGAGPEDIRLAFGNPPDATQL